MFEEVQGLTAAESRSSPIPATASLDTGKMWMRGPQVNLQTGEAPPSGAKEWGLIVHLRLHRCNIACTGRGRRQGDMMFIFGMLRIVGMSRRHQPKMDFVSPVSAHDGRT
jgi:hypothetical protein